MDEAEVKLQMRLWALEVFVANAFAMLCAQDPDPDDLLGKINRQMIEGSKRQSFPGFDPAESDVLASDFEAAVSLRALAAFIAFHLRAELVERHGAEHRDPLAEHPERHPHGALAALAPDPRITFGLKLGDSSVVCHAALKRGLRRSALVSGPRSIPGER